MIYHLYQKVVRRADMYPSFYGVTEYWWLQGVGRVARAILQSLHAKTVHYRKGGFSVPGASTDDTGGL